MEKIASKIEYRIYVTPKIEMVKLDNEISLQLESTPPVGPDELSINNQDHFSNNPFC
ncbi:MAG: hypothetical protein GZ091_04855 [Paludibacter sp.]|nr:hypothetical protein [Paludibacter sp.]